MAQAKKPVLGERKRPNMNKKNTRGSGGTVLWLWPANCAFINYDYLFQ